ncbi:MAG: glycosyltransferase family 39 protein [Patescibacteria group bacterium]|nr:glycosyltransferase family 39 protein [Patescibacteria group bacterium]MCL5431561.1 glycosyltransferase family 39 protein [Patescibacteria group bacterium]
MIKLKRADIFAWVLLTSGYLISRLVNLGIIPIFTDEAIYLRWSQIMANDAALRYLPLVDGKPPLFMWLTAVVMRLLPRLDPLLTGRLVSVGAGLASTIGIFFASYVLFKNKKISYLASLFYILTPFCFFYDRFGLDDSLLAMFGIWSLGLGVLLAKKLRLDVAMIDGIAIGFGLLTKTPANFFLVLLPTLLLFFDFRNKNWQSNLLKLAGLFMVVVVFAQGIFSVLRLFPLFSMIGQKNLEFVVPLSVLITHPLEFFPGNLHSLLSWEFVYLTPLISLISLIGLWVGLKKWPRQTLFLAAGFVLPLVAIALFNKVIYPRYLSTFTPVLLILAAVGLANCKKVSLIFLISLIVFAWPIYTDLKLITDPVHAPLLQADRDQYLDGWPAGFGVIQIRKYLAGKTGVIATEGTFGLMPYSLELYQKDYPNVEIKAYWPLPATAPAGLNYVIVYQHPGAPAGWHVELLAKYRQGLGDSYLRLYKVLPQ